MKGFILTMWKKVLYFAVTIIIGIIVALFTYMSNQYNHMYDLTNNAIKNENYVDVTKIFGGCFDTKPIASDNDEKLDAFVYNGTSLTDVTYGDKNDRFYSYEFAYYIYVFNSKYSYITINSGDSEMNKTGIILNGEDGEYYYPYIVSPTINKEYYVETPLNLEDVLLNSNRNLVDSMINWNFLAVTLTQEMIEIIEKETGTITSIDIIDNAGEIVCNIPVKFDFSQEFFHHEYMVELQTTQNYYLGLDADGKLTSDDQQDHREFSVAWEEKFIAAQEQTGYSLRFSDDYITPSKLIWQTVGMMLLYILMVAIFYILFFHFSMVKSIFSRDTYKDYSKKNKKETIITPKDKK